VKHGALLHDAEVHVDSEVGKGTVMEVLFKGEGDPSSAAS
jgi:two-component system phosphate regulon sensor histidine kinase PhoR